MKKIFTVLMTLVVSAVFAQSNPQPPVGTYTYTGKPQYRLHIKRAGVSIGNIDVELYSGIAPNHVKNFDSLVSTQFYDSTAFHRVIPGFMIQGGDPNSRNKPKSTWGQGDPSQPTVNAEFSAVRHLRGILSAARSQNINSATSQFFICVAPAAWLDGQYSVYGRVLSGMDIVDTIVSEPRDSVDNPYLKMEMFVTYTGFTDSVPSATVLNAPLDGAMGVGYTKQINWKTTPDDAMYHVQVSFDSTFSSTFYLDQDYGVYYTTLTNLVQDTVYYWRVKTHNGAHWSSYSPTWKFYTGTAGSSVDNLDFYKKGYGLGDCIPNPAQGQAEITFKLPQSEWVNLRLLDMTGKEIKVLLDEKRTKGDHQFKIDLQGLSAGTYFYQIKAGNFIEARKVVLGQ